MSATPTPATMKGPAIFLAQLIGDTAPFDSFDAICGWAAGLGYRGVQVPTTDPRMLDLDRAATSQTYCDEVMGVAARHGLVITELSTHLQGQLVAVHPAYDEALKTPRTARARVLPSSATTSSASPTAPSTISPAARSMPRRPGACWTLTRHCERSEAIQLCARGEMDCFVARAPRNDGERATFHGDIFIRSTP